ncbi:hypothetical protein [Gabonia massiliensis]|uniref:hypothetical protein n=1 Tax=Gabonia massiliensis TaxID=1686296 RepID=UPI0006D788D9|nr:hypothetical protein [Gabonia massiliensis]
MKQQLFIWYISLFLLGGCYTNKQASKFVTSAISLGISKQDFLAKYGLPFSQEMNYNDNGQKEEKLLYKEELYKGSWYIVTTSFTFQNSKLIKQEIVKEERKFKDCDCEKK